MCPFDENSPLNNPLTAKVANQIEAEFDKIRPDWRYWKDADGNERGVSYSLLVEGNEVRPTLHCPEELRFQFEPAMKRAMASLGFRRA